MLMNRRDLFRTLISGLVAAGVAPIAGRPLRIPESTPPVNPVLVSQIHSLITLDEVLSAELRSDRGYYSGPGLVLGRCFEEYYYPQPRRISMSVACRCVSENPLTIIQEPTYRKYLVCIAEMGSIQFTGVLTDYLHAIDKDFTETFDLWFEIVPQAGPIVIDQFSTVAGKLGGLRG